jgi:hypothetical protein
VANLQVDHVKQSATFGGPIRMRMEVPKR